MSIVHATRVVLIALSATVLVALVSMAVLKAIRQVATRRRDAALAAARPLVVSWLDDDSLDPPSGTARDAMAAVAMALLPKLRGADRDRLVIVLGSVGAIEDARRGLSSRRAARRRGAAELLGAAADGSSVDALCALLHDTDGGVRSEAARALGRLGVADTVPVLLTAAADERISVHTATMAVLRIVPTELAVFEMFLAHERSLLRRVAIDLIGELGLVQGVDVVAERLDDPAPEVARAACRCLGRLGSPRSTATLVRRLERAIDHRDAVTLAQDDSADIVTLVQALGQIGDPAARAALERALGLPHQVALAAAHALAAIDPGRQVPRQRTADSAVAILARHRSNAA